MIDVKPEIGGLLMGLAPIFIDPNGLVGIPMVKGKIVDIKNDLYYVADIEEYGFPLYRIRAFTFGGIEVVNYEFDIEKIIEEDKDIAKKKGLAIDENYYYYGI